MTEFQVNLACDVLRGLGWSMVAVCAVSTFINFVAGMSDFTDAQPRVIRGWFHVLFSACSMMLAAMLLFGLMSAHGVNTNFR